jgi:hypothetical protein
VAARAARHAGARSSGVGDGRRQLEPTAAAVGGLRRGSACARTRSRWDLVLAAVRPARAGACLHGLQFGYGAGTATDHLAPDGASLGTTRALADSIHRAGGASARRPDRRPAGA